MTDHLTYTTVQEHLLSLVPERHPELQAMEAYAEKHDFPIIGPAAGYHCYQIARMLGATSVFELGSGFGYSTTWFARALKENGGGRVHHTVWDQELSKKAAGHLSRMGLDGLVEYHVSEAVQALEKTPGPFDVIFNDIDKEAYPTSLPLIKRKLRPGGVLILDNILWSGRIFDQGDRSASTRGVREVTRLTIDDPDWIATIVPVRDGLLVAYKR